VPGNVVLTAGYAGTRSAHILVSQVNENIESPLACFQQILNGSNQPIPNPAYQPSYTLGCGIDSTPYGTAWPYAAPYQSVDSNNSIGQARL